CHYKLNEHLQAAAMLLIVQVQNLNEFYEKRYAYLHQQLQPYI
ncbi:MAG: regulator, partial [Vibrio sp.]|nr:regulator [Vibrio sp.]